MKNIVYLIILLLNVSFSLIANAAIVESPSRSKILTNVNNYALTKDYANDLDKLTEFLSNNPVKSIFIEQWLLQESDNKKLLKSLYSITKKHNSKLYLVTGKNSWLGYRGVDAIIPLYKQYGKYIDGIVFRCEPNRLNIWKDESIKVQALNQMLDSYSTIYNYAKKNKKAFIVEFPFWFADFIGPKGSFSDDACMLADKIVLLVDDEEKISNLQVKWNDSACPYYINLGLRATRQSEDKAKELYKLINKKVVFYSNFQGFIVDPSTKLNDLDE